ncbi:RNA-directed DNA polymerase from transposon BS [Oopsacas minuta]|uniref:RNA-directed DNA polymerase from transposon BS n=1 Tax=Oopsacas minuta TaxID=111878 RepID=A0AAV7K4A9_9METZ|nr:RNA-directed DNA polymerase from transposon BS [Oopsacas minuta]
MKSYLCQRSEAVSINGTLSNPQPVKIGIPQVSILGLILFNLYISPIEDIMHAHALSILLYADDVQLYLSLSPSNINEPILQLESCLSDINVWFGEKKFVRNTLKSNFVFFSTRSRNFLANFSITFGTSVVRPMDNVLSLGVIWDTNISLKSHVSNICKAASLSVYRIGALQFLP